MRELIKRFRYHLAVFFAVVGPGFITAVVDNDSGGIYTYSAAGARYGYLPLWTLLPITVALIIIQEMSSRMGAVTGKGLSDLIREEFGLRISFLLMGVLVLANITNVMAEFAGVASSLELFHISRYVSVPLAAFAVWFLVVKGNYQSVEKIFLFACVFYVTYVISGFLVKPDWKEAVVEKGVTAKEYKKSRIEVIVGCFMTSVIAFFIIVACAGAIYSVRPRDIQDASEAALGLKPFGEYAFLLFSAGLFNASIFAACILPLSTAYSVCEGLGFEAGVSKRMKDAPIFYSLYTLLIVVGAGVVLVPSFPLVQMILLSQVLNGILLPFVLIFMVLLINKVDIMGEWTNSRTFNLVSWATVVIMIGLTLALVGITVRGMH